MIQKQLPWRSDKDSPHFEEWSIKDNFLEVHVSHIDERKINIAAEIAAVLQPIRLAVETLHSLPSIVSELMFTRNKIHN